MIIRFEKRMVRQYEKLTIRDRHHVDEAIKRFRSNPFDPLLKNHSLKGAMQGMKAISAGYDLRIIFEERDGYTVVIMLAVGSHDDVYF